MNQTLSQLRGTCRKGISLENLPVEQHVIHDSSSYYPVTANHGGILLLLGEWSHKLSTPTSDVFAYSSEADIWVKAEKLPEPRCRFTATSQLQNGAIMLIGGVEKANKKSSGVLLVSQNF